MVQQTTLMGFDYLDGYFQDLLVESPDTDTFMGKLAVSAAATLSAPGLPVFCGLTLHRPKKGAAVAGSDSRARLLDEVQNAFNDGPSLSAIENRQCVVVPDVALERRWPRYISAAARQGIHSILAVPLQMEDGARVMLSLYSLRPRAFDGDDSARAEAFAVHASRAMRLALRITGLQQARDDMAAAMQSRTVIDVATGVLMAQNSCGQDEAFQIMRTASNNANVKLRELAGHITDALSSRQGITTHFDA
ncbi:GAF domain-containing protein [Arthrobacter sp. 9AX]|uniref:GAF and ANTAR domain-containing protein n=1 Tax=Arthrobacter sp. 9AX TaxID=2653131 RepID=UPI0012EF5820|nr:GAF and ANTAR domain-containing protein [Arthrobacter sp. 9AX]VXB97026.1 GAF domain-containing protein [Arthrobacter sp. 9AX]